MCDTAMSLTGVQDARTRHIGRASAHSARSAVDAVTPFSHGSGVGRIRGFASVALSRAPFLASDEISPKQLGSAHPAISRSVHVRGVPVSQPTMGCLTTESRIMATRSRAKRNPPAGTRGLTAWCSMLFDITVFQTIGKRVCTQPLFTSPLAYPITRVVCSESLAMNWTTLSALVITPVV